MKKHINKRLHIWTYLIAVILAISMLVITKPLAVMALATYPEKDGWKNSDDNWCNSSAVEYQGVKRNNTVYCKPGDVLGVTVWGKQDDYGDATSNHISHGYLSLDGTNNYSKYWDWADAAFSFSGQWSSAGQSDKYFIDSSTDDITLLGTDTGWSWKSYNTNIYDVGNLFWIQFNQNNKTYTPRMNLYSSNRNWLVPENTWVNSVETINVDGNAPTVTFNNNGSGWVNYSITSSFTVTDSQSGIQKYQYAYRKIGSYDWVYSDWNYPSAHSNLDNSQFKRHYVLNHDGTWAPIDIGTGTTSMSDGVTFSDQGQYQVAVQAVDNLGNSSGWQYSNYFYIDKTNPSATFNPNSSGWTNNGVGVTIYPSDDWSGVRSWQYRFSPDGGASWYGWTDSGTTGQATEWATAQGDWLLQVSVTDNAGNQKTVTSGHYYIDKTNPSGIFSPNSSGWTNQNVTTTFTPTDDYSGVSWWRYRVSEDGGSSWQNWTISAGNSAASINLPSQGDWLIQSEVHDNAGNSSIITSGHYYIDMTAPSGEFTPSSQSWTYSNVSTFFNPTDTGGSGVKQWRYRISNDNGATYGSWSNYAGGNGSSISISGPGQWKIQSEITDNAGNVGNVISGTYQICNPIPTDANLTVDQYTYKQDNNTYWVKPGDTFGITTRSYFPSEYSIYPTRTYLMLAKSNNTDAAAAPQEWNTTVSKYDFGSSFNNELTAIGNNTAAESQSNGNNYLNALHQFTAKNDGSTFNLYSKSSYLYGAAEYSNFYSDSGKVIKVDGIAPGFDDVSNSVVDSSVSTIINLDDNLNVSARIDNLFDKGSGVNSVYAKMYPNGKEAEAKTFGLSPDSSGNWILNNIDAYSLYKSADLNVDIYTKDNVGNTGKIASKKLTLLTVSAQIVPYDNQNFTGTPTLEQGQKAVLKIYTTGYADTLTISFPQELEDKDSSLNKILQITPQAHIETDVVFNVPRYIDEKQYTVKVLATNSVNSTTKETYPEFIVSDDILSGLRTGTLYDNP